LVTVSSWKTFVKLARSVVSAAILNEQGEAAQP
jgi:hypothetical protein